MNMQSMHYVLIPFKIFPKTNIFNSSSLNEGYQDDFENTLKIKQRNQVNNLKQSWKTFKSENRALNI